MSSLYAERVGFSARFAALVLTGPALNAINTTMIAAASRCPRAGRSQARMPDARGCRSGELAAGFSCSPVNDQVHRRWRGLRRR
jgi:hypothetical protein